MLENIECYEYLDAQSSYDDLKFTYYLERWVFGFEAGKEQSCLLGAVDFGKTKSFAAVN